MNSRVMTHTKASTGAPPASRSNLLQRKCACGGTPGATGECEQCRRKRLALQRKLTVNQPGDRYEQEALRVADTVARGGVPGRAAITSLGRGGAVQRDEPSEPKTQEEKYKEAAKKAGEAFLAQEPEKKEEETLRREATSDHEVSGAPPIVDDVLQSAGEPLGTATRRFFEERFGYDFGAVRVHHDARAAESARAVHADAYTVGRDVVFNSGRFSPDTEAGRRVLAHELTHVVQQTGKIMIQRQEQETPVSPPKSIEQNMIDKANAQRVNNLYFAWWTLNGIDLTFGDPAYDKSKLEKDFAPAIKALASWVKIKPADANFRDILKKVMSLIWKNYALGTKPPAFYQTKEGPKSKAGQIECAKPAYAWSHPGDASTGVACCRDFINTGPLCRIDVITHEHFHLIGLGHGEKAGKETTRAERTTEECLNSSDNMAQLVSALNGITTDNCPANR